MTNLFYFALGLWVGALLSFVVYYFLDNVTRGGFAMKNKISEKIEALEEEIEEELKSQKINDTCLDYLRGWKTTSDNLQEIYWDKTPYELEEIFYG